MLHSGNVSSIHATAIGVLYGVLSSLIPDGTLSYVAKVVLAMPIAAATGFAYAFGASQWSALQLRRAAKARAAITLPEIKTEVVIKTKPE